MKTYIKPELEVVSVMPESNIAYGDDIIVTPGDGWDGVSVPNANYFGYDD